MNYAGIDKMIKLDTKQKEMVLREILIQYLLQTKKLPQLSVIVGVNLIKIRPGEGRMVERWFASWRKSGLVKKMKQVWVYESYDYRLRS